MNQINSNITEMLNSVAEKRNTSISFRDTWNKQGSSLNYKLRRKGLMALAIFLLVLLPISGFTYYKFIWSKATIYIDNDKRDLSEVITPIEIFDNLLLKEGVKVKTIEESRKIAKFQIRIVHKVEGWNKVKSAGVITPVETRDNNGNPIVKDGDLCYMDFYKNSKGEKIVVSQSINSSFTDSTNGTAIVSRGFPSGTIILDGYGNDLVALFDTQKGRYTLWAYHKENNVQVIALEIWGNTDPEILKQFAHAYLQAEVK